MQVKVDGRRVAYTDTGSGVPVLLMHGVPDTRHSWSPVIESLAGRLRVIAPDFPGCGDSEPLPAGADLGPEAMADFWARFVEATGITEPVIVGVHDFGGPWLLPWVASAPEHIRGVLLMNTIFQRDFKWHVWARVWQRRGLGELSMGLLRRPLLHRVMRQASPQLSAALIDATYNRIHPSLRRTVLRVYRAYADPASIFLGWEQRLAAALATRPTRVIWGDRDVFIPVSFADRYPVKAVHLPNHGHWHPLSNPALVAETLLELAASR